MKDFIAHDYNNTNLMISQMDSKAQNLDVNKFKKKIPIKSEDLLIEDTTTNVDVFGRNFNQRETLE